MIDIVIIGAGISGLTCARELSRYSNDIKYIILEGSNRVGGRIRTIKADDGTTLELGAHYLHGTRRNPLYDFAVDKGVIIADKNIECNSAKVVECFPKELISTCSEEEIKQAVDIGNLYIKEFKAEMCMLSNEDISTYKTVGNYMQNRFDATLLKFVHLPNLSNTLKSVFMTWINNEKIASGCKSVYDLDLRGFLNYIDLEGNPLFTVSDHCANGYKDIINEIVKDIKINCIELNCEVNKLDNVMVDGTSKIKVSCSNGKFFYGDTTVLTVSVGVLKHFIKNNIFSISLPEAKLRSIDKLHLGNVIKVFFKFETAIEDEITSFEFYPSPSFYNTPNLERDNPDVCFDRVGCSDWWIHWMIWDDQFNMDSVVDNLNNLLASFSEMYPKFPVNKVNAKTIVLSDWVTNKFYRGSYSYLKPGTDERDIANLAQPVSYGKANLLFAGEATCRQFYSTTHGAYLTGIREAGNIKSIYELI